MAATARQSDPQAIREEGVNVLLAELLRERGIDAKAERRSRRGAPDISVDMGHGHLILLECKWESAPGLLDRQLAERLKDFPEVLGVIGVLYPMRLRREDDILAALEAATDLKWWVHGSRGVKA